MVVSAKALQRLAGICIGTAKLQQHKPATDANSPASMAKELPPVVARPLEEDKSRNEVESATRSVLVPSSVIETAKAAVPEPEARHTSVVIATQAEQKGVASPSGGAEGKQREKTQMSPNAEKRARQMQIVQEELKKQIEEKRAEREKEKLKLKEEAEREERRVQDEKRSLAQKYESESGTKNIRTVPQEVQRMFMPSEQNTLAPTLTLNLNMSKLQTPAIDPTEKLVEELRQEVEKLRREKLAAEGLAERYRCELDQVRSELLDKSRPRDVCEESLSSSTRFVQGNWGSNEVGKIMHHGSELNSEPKQEQEAVEGIFTEW